MRRQRRLTALVLATSLGLLVAGCSAGSSSSSGAGTEGAGGSTASGTTFGAAHRLTAPAAGGVPAAQSAVLSTTALDGRDLILTADVTVRVQDVPATTRKAEQLVARAHGFVAAEQVHTDPKNPNSDSATMTLRVPESSYDATIDAVEALGTTINEQKSSDDVTDQIVDTSSRLSTAKAGLARVRSLLDRASTLGQVIQLESELSKREADLESLERRLATLQRQVALATIDVTFSRTVAATHAHHHRSGFISGIVNGWHAFTRTGNGLLTALGAVLPFVLALAAAAALVVILRRRRVGPLATRGDDVTA